MKRFQYRLHALLRYREQRVEQAQARIAEAAQRVQACEAALAELQQAIAGNFAAAREMADSLWALRLADDDRRRLRRQELLQQNHLATARQALLRCRQEAFRMDQEKKILEEHQQRARDAWAHDLRVQEAKHLDEAAGARFHRQTITANKEHEQA